MEAQAQARKSRKREHHQMKEEEQEQERPPVTRLGQCEGCQGLAFDCEVYGTCHHMVCGLCADQDKEGNRELQPTHECAVCGRRNRRRYPIKNFHQQMVLFRPSEYEVYLQTKQDRAVNAMLQSDRWSGDSEQIPRKIVEQFIAAPDEFVPFTEVRRVTHGENDALPRNPFSCFLMNAQMRLTLPRSEGEGLETFFALTTFLKRREDL